MKMSVYLGKIEDRDSFGYGLDAFVSFDSDEFSERDVKSTTTIAKVLADKWHEFTTLELGKAGSFLNYNSIKELKYSFNVKNGDIASADVFPQSILISTKDGDVITIKLGKVLIVNAARLVKAMFELHHIPSAQEITSNK